MGKEPKLTASEALNRLIGIDTNLKSSAVVIQSTATAIPATSLPDRRNLLIFNNGSNTVYVGTADVSTANGYPIAAGDALALDVTDTITIYGRVAENTEELRILEGV